VYVLAGSDTIKEYSKARLRMATIIQSATVGLFVNVYNPSI